MTTIAYRDGIMASDSGISHGSTREMFIDKIVKDSAGRLCGAAGAASWISEFMAWFSAGRIGDPPTNSDGDRCYLALVIETRSKVMHYDSIRGKTSPYSVKGPYHAIGSGSDVAYGAMFAGAGAVGAVEAALRHDFGTHGKIATLRFGK